MEYDQLRDKGPNGEPSLTEMTEAAIRILQSQPGDQGFVLLVEGGRIDHAHHEGYSNMAMYETVEFDRAIRRARELLPMEETLVLVTADHSHGLTINGYPTRGNPINGWAGEDADNIPMTTLMYSTGPGHMSHEEREQSVTRNTGLSICSNTCKHLLTYYFFVKFQPQNTLSSNHLLQRLFHQLNMLGKMWAFSQQDLWLTFSVALTSSRTLPMLLVTLPALVSIEMKVTVHLKQTITVVLMVVSENGKMK